MKLTSSASTTEEPNQVPGRYWNWIIYLVCVSILAFGLYIRCSTVSVPLVWHDECTSISHAAGCSSADALAYMEDKEVTFGGVKETLLTAKKDQGVATIWRVLAKDDPHHAPVFPVLLNFWQRYINPDINQLRWATVVISLFQVPAMFWLARELCRNNKGALLATALLAVSPVNLWYAQELREYSLLVVLILASSAAVVRAARTGNVRDWLIYAGLLSMAFYASSFTIFTLASHILFVLFTHGPKIGKTYFAFSKTFLIFAGMLVGTLLACLPRFTVQLANAGQTMMMQQWMYAKRPMIDIVNQALFNAFISQFDLYKDINNGYLNIAILSIILITCLVVIARSKERTTLLFIACWAGVSILCFWVPDLLFGGLRTTIVRYWLPIPLSIVLTYAVGITLMMDRKRHVAVRVLAPVMLIFIVLCDYFSCSVLTSIPEKVFMDPMSLSKIKRVVNWDNPKLIVTSQSQGSFVNTMEIEALSTILPSELRLLWLTGDKDVEIKDDYFLLLNANDKVKEMVRNQGFELEPVIEVRETLHYLLSAKRKGTSAPEREKAPG